MDFEDIPRDSILSEPLTHPLVLAPPVPPQPPPLPPEGARATVGSVWRDGIADFLAAIAVVVVLGVLLTGFFGRLSGWGLAAFYALLQTMLFVFARKRLKRNREKGWPSPQLFAGHTSSAMMLGAGTGVALGMLSGVYTYVLEKFMKDDSVSQQLDMLRDVAGDRTLLAVFVFIIAVMAPICEEMFFRGAIFASAQSSGLGPVGAAASAVLFALAHLSMNLIPFYAFFAVAMCWLYTRTRTMAAPMAAHFTMNALACIALISQSPSEIV